MPSQTPHNTAVRTAVISGASRRLGLFLTEKLLAEQWCVHALTRSASPGLNALSSPKLHIHEHSLYDKSHCDALVASLQEQCSGVDLLIHNASIYETDSGFAKQGLAFYNSLMFIHMSLPAMLSYGLESQLKASTGVIIAITDIYTANPNQEYNLYCSTKAGLQNLTLGLAKKWAPDVRAMCIQPGPIKFLDEHDAEHRKKILSETLLAQEGGFEPVLKTVQFILENTYLTGDCIKVDGGRSLVRG